MRYRDTVNGHPFSTCANLLTWLLLATASLAAQVPAPHFLCTRSEAGQELLTWDNVPVPDCGPYEATEIYRSTAAEGPYSLLTSLSDRSITEFADDNPNGTRYFYYLQYRYGCTTAAFTSDTLDSFIPATPQIKFVSIVDGMATLYWLPSVSPEVNRYVIVDASSGNALALDTVGNVSSYRFPLTDALRRNGVFRISALDACGNDSPLSEPRSILRLDASGGEGCTTEVALFPADSAGGISPFFDRGNGQIADTQTTVSLYAGPPGQPLALYASTPFQGASPIATYPDAVAGQEICFAVALDWPGDSVSQRSDTACFRFDPEATVRPFPLYGAELDLLGQVRFAYSYSLPPPASYTQELETTGGGRLGDVFAGPLLSAAEAQTAEAIPLDLGDSLRFAFSDVCDRVVTTNWVQPVYLFAEALTNGAVRLDWTELVNELPGTFTYRLYRLESDTAQLLLTTDPDERTYLDTEVADKGQRCYEVRVSFQPEVSSEVYEFRSTPSCAVAENRVYLPSAFSPVAVREENRTFRPFFNNVFGITDYRLQVYDRWGGLQFSTEDPEEGWDGRVGGNFAPAGTYLYTLSFVTERGNLVQRSNVVNVLY